MRYHIAISGMGCEHCVKSVTATLTGLSATVRNCAIGGADIEYDGDTEAIIEAIADRGFDVTAITEA